MFSRIIGLFPQPLDLFEQNLGDSRFDNIPNLSEIPIIFTLGLAFSISGVKVTFPGGKTSHMADWPIEREICSRNLVFSLGCW